MISYPKTGRRAIVFCTFLILMLFAPAWAADYNLSDLKQKLVKNYVLYTDQNDQPVTGRLKEYYPDGTLKSEGEIADGKRNGFKRDYSPEGRLIADTNFRYGLRDGLRREYNDEGLLKIEWTYKAHKKEGPMREYENGQAIAETIYVQDAPGERRQLTGANAVPTGPIALREIELKSFAAAYSSSAAKVVPALKENKFPLTDAINFSEVEKRLGGLTAEQKKYLEEHRFLVLAKKDFIAPFADGDGGDLYDEMLANFDQIGGPYEPSYRLPEHAVFIGPDVFLQALHTFFSQRLKILEKEDLYQALKILTEGLYANAKNLKLAAGPGNETAWERLMAQLVVPLIIIQNCDPKYEPPSPYEEEEGESKNDDSDTLENALQKFTAYSGDFSAETIEAINAELTLIYKAEGQQKSQLSLVPSYNSVQVDYTQFTPRGHYESSSASRAYFRAMIWLGQLGWDLKTEDGLADGLNFALTMSSDAPPNSGEAIRAAWQEIMEISSFFVGYPDVPAYPQWQTFLTAYSAPVFSPQSHADKAMLQKLAANIKQLNPPDGPFSSLQEKSTKAVLSVFPSRFTVPWLIGDRLSYKETLAQQYLPAIFSALWVPAVMGSAYAESLLEKQVELALIGQPNAGKEASPRQMAEATIPAHLDLNQSLTALKQQIKVLAQNLREEEEANWFSSIGATWFHLLGTLTSDFGEGYPLYMRGSAFQAKQLETFMGTFTALKHDTILYEKPNYAEMGGGGDDDMEIPPVPKGFVEPNLPFWQSLLDSVNYIENGFRAFNLYPGDLEEYGALGRFKEALTLCKTLAEKELSGQPLTEEEYEALRTLDLQYMAAPVGHGVVTLEEAMSGLVVDVFTSNLNDQMGAEQVIVYEANAEPYIMLVLVGNENSPRLVTGLAYNHREFIAPYGQRISDSVWKRRVYGPEPGQSQADEAQPLPVKNFWYAPLVP